VVGLFREKGLNENMNRPKNRNLKQQRKIKKRHRKKAGLRENKSEEMGEKLTF